MKRNFYPRRAAFAPKSNDTVKLVFPHLCTRCGYRDYTTSKTRVQCPRCFKQTFSWTE